MHRPEDIEKVLATFPCTRSGVSDAATARLFDSMRITTARQFVEPARGVDTQAHGDYGSADVARVTGHRVHRLRTDAAAEAADHRLAQFPRRSTSGRSSNASSRSSLRCAPRRLRAQRALCGQIHGFIFTNRHRDDQPQRYETAVLTLPEPTDSTLEIVRQARAALRQIYRPGFGYKKPV